MEHGSWLTGSLVYLAAAVLAVPIAKALGLGSIIGYLAAGILIGPWGLKFVTDPQDMLHFAEFGVVLMIGGNIPGATRVISVQIYDHVEALAYTQAHWLSGAMLLFSFVVLLALYTYNPARRRAV